MTAGSLEAGVCPSGMKADMGFVVTRRHVSAGKVLRYPQSIGVGNGEHWLQPVDGKLQTPGEIHVCANCACLFWVTGGWTGIDS